MAAPNPTTATRRHSPAQELKLALLVDDAREKLMEAAAVADALGASNVQRHVLNAATHVDDALVALSEGVAR